MKYCLLCAGEIEESTVWMEHLTAVHGWVGAPREEPNIIIQAFMVNPMDFDMAMTVSLMAEPDELLEALQFFDFVARSRNLG